MFAKVRADTPEEALEYVKDNFDIGPITVYVLGREDFDSSGDDDDEQVKMINPHFHCMPVHAFDALVNSFYVLKSTVEPAWDYAQEVN